MHSMTTVDIKKLELRRSAEAEAAEIRRLLPPEPWKSVVADKPGLFARWITSRAQLEVANSPGTVVNARKAYQGIRPIPVLGVAERIMYRGLVDWVLRDLQPLPDRHEAYTSFVLGPLEHRRPPSGSWTRTDLENSSGEYVVQADIAAFYQYIDHRVLLAELQMQTENIVGSARLIELLAEIQKAAYGIPQLLETSDRLAEIYISIVERDLRRRGYDLWRYNDDFRISISGYSAALQALEDLSTAAHSVGLILNESKSSIVKFSTYFERHATEEMRPPEAPDSFDFLTSAIDATEYLADEDAQSLDDALEFISRITDSDSSEPLDLRDLSSDEVRGLRAAIGALTRAADETLMPELENIFRFVPQLTPSASEYLISLARDEMEGDGIGGYLDVWSATIRWAGGFNDWQRVWLVHVARECNFLQDLKCQEWVKNQLVESNESLLHAEAALALSKVGAIPFENLDQYLRTQPESLLPWYLIAIDAQNDVDGDRIEAVRGSSPLARLLVQMREA